LEPRTKEVFGISREFNPNEQELEDSGNLIHAVRMIHMFDAALNMLGPNTGTLNEILSDLGKQHIKDGVLPHYFPFVMGHAIVYALQETIGDSMSPDVTEAWVEVYNELSYAIMKSILNNS
jgi:hemoglobin-like flavoprotein